MTAPRDTTYVAERASGAVVLVRVTVPIPTPNPLNGSHKHWATAAGIRKQQRRAAFTHLLIKSLDRPELPVTVCLQRQSPGTLDDDNVRAALKGIRDGVADYLGIPDNDKRIEWLYFQKKARRGESAVVIEIQTDDEPEKEHAP